MISGLTSDQNIGDIRRRDLGLKFHLKDRKTVGSNLRPLNYTLAPKNTIQMLPKSVERSDEDYQCHLFYSIPLHFIYELNYAFPALAPVLRALNKRSIDDN